MALPRKGARRIVDDGTAYRWRVRHEPSYCQGLGWTPLSYAVERADPAGTVLVVKTGGAHPGNWVGAPATPVRPSDVADAIRTALAHGWSPDRADRPFLLDRSAGFVPAP